METIDLGEILKRRAALLRTVDAAQRALSGAQSDLSEFLEESKLTLHESIRAGRTTGDPLRDECLLAFGLEEEITPKILEFNEKLVAAKGKKCLLRFSWQVQTVHGGQGTDPGYQPATGYVLGVLSGGRLKVDNKEESLGMHGLELSFPFDRHVTVNMTRDHEQEHVMKGDYVLKFDLGLQGPEVTAFLQEVRGQENGPCSIKIVDDDATILPWLLKKLKAPTEAEQIAAAGI